MSLPLLEHQIREFNSAARDWGKLTKQDLKEKLRGYGLRGGLRANGRKSLLQSIAMRTGKDKRGIVEVIQFKFRYYGIFFEKGVGRGVPLESVSSSNRTPKPWLDPIDENLDELMDDILEKFGIGIVENLRAVFDRNFGSGNVELR